jgi:hypothetical protein
MSRAEWLRREIKSLNEQLELRFDWVDSLARQIERIELERDELARKRDRYKAELAESG